MQHLQRLLFSKKKAAHALPFALLFACSVPLASKTIYGQEDQLCMAAIIGYTNG